MNKDIPSVVYHYCSLETFNSIISNSTIRLTNIAKSNDSEEIKFCFDAFESTLQTTCLKFANKHFDDKELIDFFYEINYSSLAAKAIINESLIYYATCFSSESDLLSQWRGYANDGKGVAIGFYTAPFIKARDYKNLKFNKITYDMSEVKDGLDKYITKKLQDAYSMTDERNKTTPFMDAINDILSGMIYNAVFYKNPAFKEESEWRLVFYPFGNIRNLKVYHKSQDLSSNQLFYDRMCESIEYEKNYNSLIRGKLQFRFLDDRIISYLDINFKKIKQSLLAEIIVGPKSRIDDKELRLFLMSNGYDLSKISIKKSSATYQ